MLVISSGRLVPIILFSYSRAGAKIQLCTLLTVLQYGVVSLKIIEHKSFKTFTVSDKAF